MADRKYTVEMRVEVEFTVPDEAVVRVLENHDSHGVPQPRRSMQEGGTGWRDTMYDLPDEEAVVGMLAYNLGLQGRPLDSLDGWADIEDPAKAQNRFMRRYSGQILNTEVQHFDRVAL